MVGLIVTVRYPHIVGDSQEHWPTAKHYTVSEIGILRVYACDDQLLATYNSSGWCSCYPIKRID